MFNSAVNKKNYFNFISMKKLNKLLPEYIVLNKLGTPTKVLVRQSNRAARISIRINSQQVELVLPNKIALSTAYNFLLQKEAWVRNKLQKSLPLVPIDKTTIPIFDKVHSITHIEVNYVKVHINNNKVIVYSPPQKHQKTLINFLQNSLLTEVTAIVTSLEQEHQFNFSAIKITNSKTKWGSCSSKSVLFFNWRLIMAPKRILKYVVIHELCHLIEMNHSKRFWQLVAAFCPDYSDSRLWLKENGYKLFQYL